MHTNEDEIFVIGDRVSWVDVEWSCCGQHKLGGIEYTGKIVALYGKTALVEAHISLNNRIMHRDRLTKLPKDLVADSIFLKYNIKRK